MVERIPDVKTRHLEEKCKIIRQQVLDYHYKTQISHVGSSLSCVEILVALYYDVLTQKDTFILSKGHASSTLYVILHDKGSLPSDELYTLEEHPSLNKQFGIETSTGSLGHGLSIGLGMALAERDQTCHVLLSDGECDEGQVWEAAHLASQLEAVNLKAVVDCNGWQAFKRSDYSSLAEKFQAFGWEAHWCNGHNLQELSDCLKMDAQKPLVVLARTVKGKGWEKMEDRLESHYKKIERPVKPI